MKLFLSLAIACLCQFSFGFNAAVNCALTPVTGSYALVAPSLQSTLKNLYLRPTPTLSISNPTTFRICTYAQGLGTVTPTAGNGSEFCVAAGAIEVFDVVPAPRGPANVFMRADPVGTQCNSGTVDVTIW